MGIYATDLQKLYVAYFNRPADPVGLAYWETIVENGGAANSAATLVAVSKSFAASSEYTAAFAGLDNNRVITQVYQNLFSRVPDEGGLTFWSLRLALGDLTIAQIVLAISDSAVTSGNSDGVTFTNKVTAASAFTTSVDTTTEILGYSGSAALALAKAFISGVTDAATLAAAIEPAALAATVLAVTDAGNVVPGQTFTLTAGIDTVPGTAGNDTINGVVGSSLSGLDNIDGGAGTDTLNVTDTALIAIPASAIVKNVETANLTSASTVSGNVSGWTNLTKLNISESGGTAAGITAAATTAVNLVDSAQAAGIITVNGGSTVSVTATGSTTGSITASGAAGAVTVSNTSAGNVSMGAINVTGGTTVSITQAATNAVNTTATMGTIAVTGTAATTAVTVSNAKAATASATVAGINTNSVSISDVNAGSATDAGTITSVTVSGYSTLGIVDNALTTLSVANGSGNIIINNSGLTTATNKTLALTINGQTGGTLDDADIYTTLNVTTATAASTLANLTFGGLTALTVAGTKGLTLTSAAGLSALKTVTVSGAAGITADLSGATVTAVDTSASTGTSTVTVDATKATFTGGAGVDFVTTSLAAPTKAISLGAGLDQLTLAGGTTVVTGAIDGGADTDTLSMAAADAATASGSATFATKVTGFEHLTLSGATNQTVDVAALGNFNYVTTAGGNGLTLNNMTSGGTLALTGAGTAYTIANTAFTPIGATSDVINVSLTDGSGAGVLFASTGLTAAGVETFAITTADTQATPTGTFNESLTLLGNTATTVTAAGNAGLALTAASTALTSVDASGITLGGFAFTSGVLAAAATIKGSATGTNIVDASLATKAVTYTGGTGVDTLTITNGQANVITLGNGVNTVTAAAGNNTITGGTGVDTVTVGGGVNTITTGTGADIVTFNAVTASGNTYSTVTDAHVGGTIVFADSGQTSGTSTFVTANAGALLNPGTAVFQDYLDAAAASAAAGTNSVISWFTFGGNTYVVEDNSDGVTFQNGVDSIVKLTGTFDLSTATFTAVPITSTALTLA